MMRMLQKLGRSLMLPVATLPVAALMMGFGYWIDPDGWGATNVVAAFLLTAGGAIIGNMALLFAIGVAIGMSDDNDGTAALAGLVSWLMVTVLLSPDSMSMFLGVDVAEIGLAFFRIENVFVGIGCGLIGAFCYNKFKNTKLPDALAFFSGKRCVAIVTAGMSVVFAAVMSFIWPVVFNGLVRFGEGISGLGAFGAGIYAFFNRLLIPLGLHHALNAVFWFDIAGINDLPKFWGAVEGGVLGETGMYMVGFFPFMMFGLPAAGLAMYHTAKTKNKKIVAGLMISASLSAFLVGVTEPIEFAFMFVAPLLYLIHAILAGITAFIMAALPIRSGFNFSGGFIDWLLSSRTPFALNPLMVPVVGVVVGVVYYSVFRFAITKFNLMTPGREEDDLEAEKAAVLSNDDFTEVAKIILEGLGGKENIAELDNCVTRLRMEVKDNLLVNEKKIKSAGVAGIIRPSKTSVQVIVGTKVQFVADEMKKML